jgi:hypothetical protein
MITKRISLTAMAAVLVTALGATAAMAGEGGGGGHPYRFGGPLWQPTSAATTQQAAVPTQGTMGESGMTGPVNQSQMKRMTEMCDQMNSTPSASPGSPMMTPHHG